VIEPVEHKGYRKDETQEEPEDRMATCEAADRRQRYRKKATRIN
jgi:hypothetical protein